MNVFNPFDPELTDEQRAKVQRDAQQRLIERRCEETKRLAALDADLDERVTARYPADRDLRARAKRMLAKAVAVAQGVDDHSPTSDQFEAALEAAEQIVEEYKRRFLSRDAQALLDAVEGLRGLGRLRGFAKFRKLRRIVDDAFGQYNRPDGFGDSTRDPMRQLTGYTVERVFPTPGNVPDTRVYAIVPRWANIERIPVSTADELRKFIEDTQAERFCDLTLRSGFCDRSKVSDSAVLPFFQSDVIVCVSTCSSCLKEYLKQQGFKGGDIIDPDDVID
ncbi:hypothetical protein [Mycobacterium sp. SMC-4]|uniref:hypothetical protein n=1 Tax=Mycobacterium sp. SMC-4 TaxID=2857059 RepID=UPI003D00A602